VDAVEAFLKQGLHPLDSERVRPLLRWKPGGLMTEAPEDGKDHDGAHGYCPGRLLLATLLHLSRQSHGFKEEAKVAL
jgi:hypothetical protein